MNAALAYVDYAVGAYCKTILLATKNKQWLGGLRDHVLRLFSGDMAEFDICKLAGIKCSGAISELKLIRVNKSAVPSVAAIGAGKQRFFSRSGKQGIEENDTCWVWRQDVEEIETLLGLIDGLLDSDSGHQYLAEEGDGCIIELSYNEGIPWEE